MAKRTLYVCRPLLNGAELHKWAASQGFKSALPADDMHVTIAFSRELVDHEKIKGLTGKLAISGGGRSIEKLGDAIVLRFLSRSLAKRWQELRDTGASWDWPNYKPHITISYKGAPADIKNIKPYRGALTFGPEKFAEVDDDNKADSEKSEIKLKSPGKDRAAKLLNRGLISEKQYGRI